MGITTIEWCDRTWNPTRGCSRVSEGCRHCYAEVQAARYSAYGAKPDSPFAGFVTKVNGHASWTGKVELVESMLNLPLTWKKPARIFCTSMSDMYHEAIPVEALDRMYAVMALADWHTYQNLSKRPERRRAYLSDAQTPYRVQRAIDKILVDEEMRHTREAWKAIDGYDAYSVSNFGEIRSSKGVGRTLQQSAHSGGYKQVALCSEGSPKTFLVHQLVLSAFAKRKPEGGESRHRTGDRTDNRIANLSWGDKQSNMEDASRHGTAGVWMKGNATLTPTEVTEIRRLRKDGLKLDEIAQRFNSNRQQISAVCLKRIFKPSSLLWPLPQVWEGVSVEDQATADERIPFLLMTPAAKRFVSYEPALGPVDFTRWVRKSESSIDYAQRVGYEAPPGVADRIDWLIIGGESGPGARPFNLDWAIDLRDQCKAAGTSFFFKQAGALPVTVHPFSFPKGTKFDAEMFGGLPLKVNLKDRKGGDLFELPTSLRVREFPA